MQALRMGCIGAAVAVCLGLSSASMGATVAYWRFEEGPVDTPVLRDGQPDGVFHPAVMDISGNDNHLSAWSEGGCCGHLYRADVAAATIPQTSAVNNFSVQNSDWAPGLFTQTGAPIQSISPAAWTIEVSFKPELGGHRTLVGRDSQGTVTNQGALSALYFQLQPDNSIAIKFSDVSGYWHQAVSVPETVQGYTAPNTGEGRWYHAAAVSTGTQLLLYLADASAGTGYQLVAQTDMTLSGSPNTALTAGAGDGGDWDAGNWSVGRGLYNGSHGDRVYGFIDEVRISDVALAPSQFLFSEPAEAVTVAPATLDVAAVDAPAIVTVAIPSTCNQSQAVDVTFTSDNPATARPAGSEGSSVVHFPAGGETSALATVEFGSPGQAQFTVSAGDCPVEPGAVLTVTVHGAESVDLQVPNDVMVVGLSQQVRVFANYGPAGSRDVTAASRGTTYTAVPEGIVEIGPDGLITAVGMGTATVTATHGGISSPERIIAVTPASHTVAYWRFEEGPADAFVERGGEPNGVFYPGVADSSGNGNNLSAWSDGGFGGYAYRTDRAEETVPQTGAANQFSVQNTGGSPGMFTQTGAPIQTITPEAWTIEISIKPETGGYCTYVGRDSQGTAQYPTPDAALSALYLQKQPDHSLAIKFCDVSGYWHQAISAPGLIQGYEYPNVDQGRWYHIAAISDGRFLSLYLNDVTAGTGYQLVAQTDMSLSGSPNTALTAGAGDGGDWDAGNWSVGRGLHGGNHVDRGYGFIDEVRISAAALHPSQFLFTPERVVVWPETIDAAPIDPPATVSLVIPAKCNEGQSLDVTITSDAPAVAKPVGSEGSAVVHFPAGNGRMQSLPIEFGQVGQAQFSLATTGDCLVTPGAALTVHVHALESIDLQVTYDIMKIGQSQQAAVHAGFGPAGTRDVTAASFGTVYMVEPEGVVEVSPDGLITALGLGTATVTAAHGGLISAQHTIAVKPVESRIKVAGSGLLLVNLEAADATAGQPIWVNKGSLGDFYAVGQPVVETVAGHKAVTFNGAEAYQGPLAPVELRGGQGRTIEVWVFNPALEGETEGQRVENMVSWGHRGGPTGTLVAFNYGDHPDWGGAGGWGTAADIGWNPEGPGAPALGEWHHLVYTYDPDLDFGTITLYDNGVSMNSKSVGAMATHPGHINLCVQNRSANPMDLYLEEIGVLSLAVVRVHDGALTAQEVAFNYKLGVSGRGEVPPDLNLDSHVDNADWTLFQQCAAGPRITLTPECEMVDFDLDGDGDQDDFGIFQRCFTGPDVVATPDCLRLESE